MKKKMLLAALIVMIISTIATGTLAYFAEEDTARNVITAGTIDIELVEMTDTGEEFTDVDGVMPGSEISKIVTVENIGTADAYVRIGLTKAIALAEGVTGEVDLDLIACDFNTEDWTERDGYYYYNTPLASGDETTPLFTTVTFATAMDDLYQGSEATIDVTAQAVQVANNGDTVFDAAGWTE